MNRATTAFPSPTTMLGLLVLRARIVVSRTWRVERILPTTVPSSETSKKGVSVDPGHTARTRMPSYLVSRQSASVNESTNALVAP